MAEHTPGSWIRGPLLVGRHSGDDASDRTPNVGLVPDGNSIPWWQYPRWPLLRGPVVAAAGSCDCCGGLVDIGGHCACSR